MTQELVCKCGKRLRVKVQTAMTRVKCPACEYISSVSVQSPAPEAAPEPTPQLKKRCFGCGLDCSNAPRIKDARGHYYHRECYERVRSHRTTQPLNPGEIVATSNSAESEPRSNEPFGPMAEVLAAESKKARFPSHEPNEDGSQGYEISHQDDRPLQIPSECPSCSIPVASGVVLCIECGFNFTTRKKLTAHKTKEEFFADTASELKKLQTEMLRAALLPIAMGFVGLILYFGVMALMIMSVRFGDVETPFWIVVLGPFGLFPIIHVAKKVVQARTRPYERRLRELQAELETLEEDLHPLRYQVGKIVGGIVAILIVIAVAYLVYRWLRPMVLYE